MQTDLQQPNCCGRIPSQAPHHIYLKGCGVAGAYKGGRSLDPILDALVYSGMHPLQQAARLQVQMVQLRAPWLRGWLWLFLSLRFTSKFQSRRRAMCLDSSTQGQAQPLPISKSYISTLTGP